MSSSVETASTLSHPAAHRANGSQASETFWSSVAVPQSAPRFSIRSGAKKKTGLGPSSSVDPAPSGSSGSCQPRRCGRGGRRSGRGRRCGPCRRRTRRRRRHARREAEPVDDVVGEHPLDEIADLHGARVGDVDLADLRRSRRLGQPGAVALRADGERHRPLHEGPDVRLERVDVLGQVRLLNLRDETRIGQGCCRRPGSWWTPGRKGRSVPSW